MAAHVVTAPAASVTFQRLQSGEEAWIDPAASENRTAVGLEGFDPWLEGRAVATYAFDLRNR